MQFLQRGAFSPCHLPSYKSCIVHCVVLVCPVICCGCLCCVVCCIYVSALSCVERPVICSGVFVLCCVLYYVSALSCLVRPVICSGVVSCYQCIVVCSTSCYMFCVVLCVVDVYIYVSALLCVVRPVILCSVLCRVLYMSVDCPCSASCYVCLVLYMCSVSVTLCGWLYVVSCYRVFLCCLVRCLCLCCWALSVDLHVVTAQSTECWLTDHTTVSEILNGAHLLTRTDFRLPMSNRAQSIGQTTIQQVL